MLTCTNSKANKYGMKTANISHFINKGVNMRYKSVTANFFTGLGLIVELSTATE